MKTPDAKKPYVLPDPKENPVACLTLAYKVTKGVPFDLRSWDQVHWARASKSAKALLDICGSLREADACLIEIAGKFDAEGISWTLETIVKHSHEWVAKRRTNVAPNEHRRRLYQAFTERSGSASSLGSGEGHRALPDPGRNQPAGPARDQKDPD